MHVHFDIAEAERKIRASHDELIRRVRIENIGGDDLTANEIQNRLFEPLLAAQLEILRMRNDGVPPEFIGIAAGDFIGNVAFHAAVSASDGERCWAALVSAFVSVVSAGFGGEAAECMMQGFELAGQTGGRA
ncbi:hypothetical protein [Ruixingdingia sedimenti]|uniref:Uncharacterized protein n=1 Tax=Ruixingdingia sedimenti TaxID=3073604 RepID=A0ABU1FFG5_9RHOB|nr:hypothetical protein [Xinfangfangia sp. LG-4]MDR5655224.1 hypothetical protein [Xinfangfangia sp. LG-4]